MKDVRTIFFAFMINSGSFKLVLKWGVKGVNPISAFICFRNKNLSSGRLHFFLSLFSPPTVFSLILPRHRSKYPVSHVGQGISVRVLSKFFQRKNILRECHGIYTMLPKITKLSRQL
jgi:hypothetical protein